jgi:hypothetical protein
MADAAPSILWESAPQPAAFVRRALMPAAPVAAVILAAGIVWEYMALTSAHLWIYPPVGALPILVGIYGLAVRPLLLLRLARRTRYAVGGRGVIIAWGERAEERVELSAASLPPFARRVQRGGDDIVFAAAPDRVPAFGWWAVNDHRLRFACLADADAALAALEKLKELERLETQDAHTAARAESVSTPAGRRAEDYSTSG